MYQVVTYASEDKRKVFSMLIKAPLNEGEWGMKV
jgi:hypothetical protein